MTGDVGKMLAAAYGDNYFGPFYLYVAKNVWAAIQQDYSSEKAGTFKQRIEDFSDIMMPFEQATGCRLAMSCLVQMTSDVVDLAIGQDIVAIEHMYNGMQTVFKVFAAMAPRVKSDRNGNSGVVHGSV